MNVVYFGRWRKGGSKSRVASVCLLPHVQHCPVVTAESSSREELGSNSEGLSFGQELPGTETFHSVLSERIEVLFQEK